MIHIKPNEVRALRDGKNISLKEARQSILKHELRRELKNRTISAEDALILLMREKVI